MSDRDQDVIEMPIDGELDLHTFAPADVEDLVESYVDEAAARGLDEIRVVHGKGTGALRLIVHGVPRATRWWWPSVSATSATAAGARPR